MKTKIRLWLPATMLALSSLFLVTNCTKDNDATIPVLTTTEATEVTQTTATSGGVISSDGGATVTERGVCWSTSENPTIADNKTLDGIGVGSFTSAITGLIANTTYYVRAYATNSKGTCYGSAMSFITIEGPTITYGSISDIENNTYKTLTIGTQTWMAENLNVTKYNDGTTIQNVTDATTWSELNTGALCDYENTPSNSETYGKLYNWYAVETEKLCPSGWHVPSDDEWSTLQNYLIANGSNYDGSTTDNYIAKSMASTTGWNISTLSGAIGNYPSTNNTSGFTALPGGGRADDGTFSLVGNNGLWWSSTENSTGFASFRSLDYSEGGLSDNSNYKVYGFSIRCLRN